MPRASIRASTEDSGSSTSVSSDPQALLVDLFFHHRHEQRRRSRPRGGATPRVLVEQLPAVALLDPGEQVGAEIALAHGAQPVVGRARVEQVAADQRVEGHARELAARRGHGALERFRVVG